MKNPHSQGWKDSQEANRLTAIANRVYSDDLEPKCDRSRLRAGYIAAVRRLGSQWVFAAPLKKNQLAAKAA